MGNDAGIWEYLCNYLHNFSALDFYTGFEVFKITHNLYLLEF